MFEAYKVAVKLTLTDGISKGLLLISQKFKILNAEANAFEARLKSITRVGLIGGGLAAGGFFGLFGLSKALKPAQDYVHQLNIMNMAGMKQVEIAQAVADAWKTTHTVMTTTATENLKTFLDLRNILGQNEANMALPIVARIQAVLAASTEGRVSRNAQNLGFSMAKALDIIGAVKDKSTFEQQADLMAKVIVATQGRVTPEQYKSVFAYARQSKLSLDNQFKYGFLPSLMLEYSGSGGGGGGSRGVGPMLAAMYRFTNQGYINRQSLPLLASLGLVNPGTALQTTTSGTTVGALQGASLAAADPFLWVQQVLVPAIRKKYGNVSNQQLAFIINQIARGNQLAGAGFTEFALKPYAFYRDEALIKNAMLPSAAYNAALSNDPNTAFTAFHSAWQNFLISFGMTVIPILVPGLIKLAKGLDDLADIFRKHRELAKTLTVAFAGLFSAMAIGGTVLLLGAAFAALVSPIGAVVAGITALIGVFTFLNDKFFSKHQIHSTTGGIGPGTHPLLGGIVGGMIRNNGSAIHVTNVHLDGKQVARVVTQHQARMATQPPTHGSAFDMNMSLAPVQYQGVS